MKMEHCGWFHQNGYGGGVLCWLPKAAADNLTAWPESVRNFTVIGAHKDTNSQWIITLTMEAFAALMIENNMKKWEAMFTYNFPPGKQRRKFKLRAKVELLLVSLIHWLLLMRKQQLVICK